MLRLFRRIRRRLLRENRFTRYAVYAFGEIVLIVIGVLLALSVSNANARRQATAQSRAHLSNMLEDLAVDTTHLGRMLRQLEVQLQAEDWLLQKRRFTAIDVDSVKLAIGRRNWQFFINDRAFQNIQNTSGEKLAGFDALYGKVSNYYLTTQQRVRQNNALELRALAAPPPFEQLIYDNLLLNTRQYNDYSGFALSVALDPAPTAENFGLVAESLQRIGTRNALYDRYLRHSYIFGTLSLCQVEAQQLMARIRSALAD